MSEESIETDIGKRWEKGIPHHPKSLELMRALCGIDTEYCNDHFCWKVGGDGDNGETLMYEMDIFFERKDLEAAGEGADGKIAPLGEIRIIIQPHTISREVWHNGHKISGREVFSDGQGGCMGVSPLNKKQSRLVEVADAAMEALRSFLKPIE
jgi:hypothetical protein